ncbi:MAG: hypothetical protein WB760_25300 [Xanthobacteraceae bacterium]
MKFGGTCIAAKAVALQQIGLKSGEENNAGTSPKQKDRWKKAIERAKNK